MIYSMPVRENVRNRIKPVWFIGLWERYVREMSGIIGGVDLDQAIGLDAVDVEVIVRVVVSDGSLREVLEAF